MVKIAKITKKTSIIAEFFSESSLAQIFNLRGFYKIKNIDSGNQFLLLQNKTKDEEVRICLDVATVCFLTLFIIKFLNCSESEIKATFDYDEKRTMQNQISSLESQLSMNTRGK